MTTEPSVPEEVLSALRHHQRVLIAAHTHPDPDAMGSCLALAWALRSIGVDALVFNEDGMPSYLNFLTLPGPVLTGLDRLPCEPELVVCLDCGDRARLGEAIQPLLDRVPTVNIDHHLANPLFGTAANWVEPGMAATGELVVTTLTRLGMPVLRYRTKDITRLHYEPCPCGRTHARMDKVMGRTDDMLIIKGVNVFPSQIESVLVGMENVGPHYQLVVRKKNFLDNLEVKVELIDGSLLENFRKFAFQGKKLVYTDAPPAETLFREHPDACAIPPGTVPDDPRFAAFGHYRRINAALALEAVARSGLMDRETAREALLSFPGVGRRLQLHCAGEKQLLIEDYAHHPTEIAASIRTLRELHPGKRLVVIFQPHRYARLKRYFREFARELAAADAVFVTPVFAAWTETDSLDSKDLARAIGSRARALNGSWKAMTDEIFPLLRENDLVAVIGAGDVKEILPFLKEKIRRIPDLALVFAAGGSSRRFGNGDKLFAQLNGEPVFLHALRALLPCVRAGYAVMAVPETKRDKFIEALRQHFPEALKVLRFAPGGETRTQSVRNALAALPEDAEIVAVHDAARPLITAEALADCVRACRICGGAVSARRASDTIKETDDNGIVIRTLPRGNLWTVQTPQVFRLPLLRNACLAAEKQGGTFTDDASLVETFTRAKVHLVENRTENIKITYPGDLLFAEACLKERRGR